MFLVDRFLVALGERILEAADAEGPTPEKLRAELQELHRSLESKRISEADFDREEARLLDRLDEFEAEAGADDEPEPAPARPRSRRKGK